MKLERISSNKIKYSISFDELTERGILVNDLDSPVWNHLFDEMLELADEAYDVGGSEMLSIEIYSLSVHEMVLILTLGEEDEATSGRDWFDEDNPLQEDVYWFQSIEEVIALARFLKNVGQIAETSLYCFEERYYLLVEPGAKMAPFFLEYGERARISPFMVREYGLAVFENGALHRILEHFR
ncbi:hypothetical protein BpJC7_06230 [Weizmannia acidilactici]|uniref:Uncharacterized protein n=1 Tax=Weizmannia acidilactici TaxID=2607726 RepID=A0A5J4JFT7_9BACI|nr:adaptor protein MecA [Weizmannia acidilactici]GER66045.1 hypothetical protein BpJC4_05160 [Weizmannia acidilactici]GER69320.1 hypothetical protein BpJC7_06230 [Weizmannia acidilactici]GER72354.1 hypothetical protein BpPP18_04210 [Weizmannia acidilactici]